MKNNGLIFNFFYIKKGYSTLAGDLMNKKWQERQEMFMSRTKSKLPFTVVFRDSVIYVCLPQHCSLIKLKKTIQKKHNFGFGCALSESVFMLYNFENGSKRTFFD